MKKIALYAVMFALTFAAIELLCSAMLLYRYRSLGQVPPFAGEPALSTALIAKKAWASLAPDRPAPPPKTEAAPAPAAPVENKHQSKTPRIKDGQNIVSDPYPFYVADAELGFSGKPGSYVFLSQKKQGELYTFFKNKVTMLADKTRYVGKSPANPTRNVYVFGDSFVLGEGVNDEQTFTYLLQNAFDTYAFHLYAMGGYGTAQAYINYKKLAPKITAGDIIILGYGDYYKPRDVAAPSRLREYGEPRPIIKDSRITHTKASLAPGGAIRIEYVPLFCKYNKDYCAAPDPSPEEMNKVTIALVNAIVKDTPAKVFLLHFWGASDDPVLKALPKNVTVIPATLDDFDYEIKDDIMGFDAHPGPFWHYALFNRISQYLRGR